MHLPSHPIHASNLCLAFAALAAGPWLAGCGGPASEPGAGPLPGADPMADAGTPSPASAPPDVTFEGGTLADLEALAPALELGDLTIAGDLLLTRSATLNVRSLRIAETGSIRFEPDECDYGDAPDLTVRAEGAVELGGPILLRGVNGGTSAVTGEPIPCHACFGSDGGSVDIEAERIAALAPVILAGGNGGDAFVPGGGTTGCAGGNGGRLRLHAVQEVRIEARYDVDGGWGGIGTYGVASDGATGTLDWSAPEVSTVEQESNGRLEHPQPLPFTALTVTGTVSPDDDTQWSDDAVYLSFGDLGSDRVEDLFHFRIRSQDEGSVTIALAAADPSVDLDLYLMDSTSLEILGGLDNSPDGTESFSATVGSGRYLVAVSYYCTGACQADPQPYVLDIRPAP